MTSPAMALEAPQALPVAGEASMESLGLLAGHQADAIAAGIGNGLMLDGLVEVGDVAAQIRCRSRRGKTRAARASAPSRRGRARARCAPALLQQPQLAGADHRQACGPTRRVPATATATGRDGRQPGPPAASGFPRRGRPPRSAAAPGRAMGGSAEAPARSRGAGGRSAISAAPTRSRAIDLPAAARAQIGMRGGDRRQRRRAARLRRSSSAWRRRGDG